MLGIHCMHWAFSISSLESESAPSMTCQVQGRLSLCCALQGSWKPWEEVPVGAAFLSPSWAPMALPVLEVTVKVCSIMVVVREVCILFCSKNLQIFKQVRRRLEGQNPSNNKVCSWELDMRKLNNSPRVNVPISGFWKVSVVLLSFLRMSLLVSEIFFTVDLIDPYSINEQLSLSDDTFLYLVWNSGLSG